MESTLAWIQASDLDLLPLWLQVCHCVHYRMHREHQRAGKCRGIILLATDTWEWWEVMGLQSGERVLDLAREGWSDEAVGSGPQMWLSGHSFTCNLQSFNASLSVLLWRSCNRYMKLLITDNCTDGSIVIKLRCNTTEPMEHGLGVQTPGLNAKGVVRKSSDTEKSRRVNMDISTPSLWQSYDLIHHIVCPIWIFIKIEAQRAELWWEGVWYKKASNQMKA